MNPRTPLIASAAFVLTVQMVHAKQYEPEVERPETLQEVQDELKSMMEYVDTETSCGGWIGSETQAGISPQAFPSIQGATGRNAADHLGSIESGLGVRGDYSFSAQTYGYMSACHVGDVKVNPNKLCMIGEQNATPKQCREWYRYLVDDVRPGNAGPQRDFETCADIIYPQWECYDDPLTDLCIGEECYGSPNDFGLPDDQGCGFEFKCYEWGVGQPGDPVKGRRYCDPPTPVAPNAFGECPPGQVYQTNPLCIIGGDGRGITIEPLEQRYNVSSFYRHFGPLGQTPADVEDVLNNSLENVVYTQGFPVTSEGQPTQRLGGDCYEYYLYHDARTDRIPNWNKRCELYETDDTDTYKGWPMWEFKQKAELKPNTNIEPYRFNELNPRPATPEDRNATDGLVYDTETNLTLLDIEGAEEAGLTNDEFFYPYLNVNSTSILEASRTSGQNRADAFDDATDPSNADEQRVFTRWWEEQQKELLKITYQPSIRILLPATLGVGLDTDDPLLQLATKVETEHDGVVELELRAGPDAIGNLLTSLQRSRIMVPREVSIPIVAPLASDEEITASIAEWKLWEAEHQQSAASVIERLYAYRDQVRNVRLLRTALPRHLEGVLKTQEEIRSFFSEWYLQNAENLLGWAEESEDRYAVQKKWRSASNELIALHDGCELRWCSNARYSLPVYSLLDEWYPPDLSENPSIPLGTAPRPPLTTLLAQENSLAQFDWEVDPDIAIDFSNLATQAGSFYIPVLDITSVPVTLPRPKGGGAPLADDFPDMPDIPVLTDDDIRQIFTPVSLPNVNEPTLDDRHYVPAPPDNDYTPILARLEQIETMIRKAKDSYCQFRHSIDDDQRNATNSGEEGTETSEQMQGRKIVHTEFDLRERIGRLFARPTPLGAEDYEGRTSRLGTNKPSCDDDVTCIDLPPEITTSFTWQITAPDDLIDKFNQVGNDVRVLTMPADEEQNPYEDVTTEDLDRINPEIPVHSDGLPIRAIDLRIPPPPEE